MNTVSSRWIWIAALLLLGWLVYLLQPILSPFVVGFLLAYLGDPIVDRLERYRVPRTVGVCLVFIMFSLVLLLLILVLVPMLWRQMLRLYQLMPQAIDWLQNVAMPWIQVQLGLDENVWDFNHLRDLLSGNLDKTTDVLKIILSKATSSGMAFINWMVNLFLIPVVCFYMMRDWDLVMARLRSLLPRKYETRAVNLATECHEVLGAFMRGQLLVMLALGTVYAIGLMLMGLELGLLIGVFAGLASIVPYMGFIVGIAAAIIAGLFQFGVELYPMLGIVLVFGIGQVLESTVFTPLLVGDRIGLHPVAVIFAILAGGQLFGFIGILLALPVAAVIMVLLRHLFSMYTGSHLYTKPAKPKDSSG